MPRRKATNPDGTPKATRGYKVSPKALEQRRANARKNSGQKRIHSCKHAALNAVTHGGYSQADVLENESADAFQARVNLFLTCLGAESALERLIATDAARYSLRRERLLGADDSRLGQQVLEAQKGRHAERAREVADWAERLLERPAEAVAHLEETAPGCDYLLSQWRMMAADLAREKTLWPSQRPRVLALCGKRPTALCHDAEVWRWTRYYLGSVIRPTLPCTPAEGAGNLLAAERSPEVTDLEWGERMRHLVKDRPSPEESVAKLREMIEAKVAALEARHAALVAHEARELRLEVAAAECDDSPAGARRHREAASLQKLQYQAMDKVQALRRARLSGELEPSPMEETGSDPLTRRRGGAEGGSEAGTDSDPKPGPGPEPGPGPDPISACGGDAEVCRNGTKSGAEAGPETIKQVAVDEEVMYESPAPATSISSPAGTKSEGTKSGDEIPPLALPAPRALPAPAVAPAPVLDPVDPIARDGAESPVDRSGPTESSAGPTPARGCRPSPRYKRYRPPRGGLGLRSGDDHYPRDD
jgi:hypothetical protein